MIFIGFLNHFFKTYYLISHIKLQKMLALHLILMPFNNKTNTNLFLSIEMIKGYQDQQFL